MYLLGWNEKSSRQDEKIVPLASQTSAQLLSRCMAGWATKRMLVASWDVDWLQLNISEHNYGKPRGFRGNIIAIHSLQEASGARLAVDLNLHAIYLFCSRLLLLRQCAGFQITIVIYGRLAAFNFDMVVVFL